MHRWSQTKLQNSFFHFLRISCYTFWHYSVLFLIPFRSYPTSIYTQLHILSLKKQKQQRNTHTKKNHGVWFVFSQLLLSMGPVLKCSWHTQWHSAEESWFSRSQSLWNRNSFLAKGDVLCFLLSCVVRFYLAWAFEGVWCLSLCEFICVCHSASKKCYLIVTPRLPHRFFSLHWRNVTQTFTWGLQLQVSLPIVLLLISISCKKLLWWRLTSSLIYGYSNMILEVLSVMFI